MFEFLFLFFFTGFKITPHFPYSNFYFSCVAFKFDTFKTVLIAHLLFRTSKWKNKINFNIKFHCYYASAAGMSKLMSFLATPININSNLSIR